MGVYVYQNEQLDKVAGLGYDVVDSAISSSSENPVQNKVVKEYVDTSANAKVSKDQGVGQSGKVLGINANGMVEPVDVAGSASDITYDNSTSGLSATDVQGAVDEVVSDIGTINNTVINLDGLVYKTSDTTDTNISTTDLIPFTTNSTKKKITFGNFVTTLKSSLANYFGRKFSQSNGTLSLLAEDNTVLNYIALSPLAKNTSYTDTNSIGATNVQSAVDYFSTYSEGVATANGTYFSGGISWQKIGKLVVVFFEVSTTANLPSDSWTTKLFTNLPPIRTQGSGAKKWVVPADNPSKQPMILAATNSSGYDNTCIYNWGNSSVTSGTAYRGSFEYFTK